MGLERDLSEIQIELDDEKEYQTGSSNLETCRITSTLSDRKKTLNGQRRCQCGVLKIDSDEILRRIFWSLQTSHGQYYRK